MNVSLLHSFWQLNLRSMAKPVHIFNYSTSYQYCNVIKHDDERTIYATLWTDTWTESVSIVRKVEWRFRRTHNTNIHYLWQELSRLHIPAKCVFLVPEQAPRSLCNTLARKPDVSLSERNLGRGCSRAKGFSSRWMSPSSSMSPCLSERQQIQQKTMRSRAASSPHFLRLFCCVYETFFVMQQTAACLHSSLLHLLLQSARCSCCRCPTLEK